MYVCMSANAGTVHIMLKVVADAVTDHLLVDPLAHMAAPH